MRMAQVRCTPIPTAMVIATNRVTPERSWTIRWRMVHASRGLALAGGSCRPG